MQSGNVGFGGLSFFDTRHTESYCAGFREDGARAPKDRITIQGLSETNSYKSPLFLTVLEERVISASTQSLET